VPTFRHHHLTDVAPEPPAPTPAPMSPPLQGGKNKKLPQVPADNSRLGVNSLHHSRSASQPPNLPSRDPLRDLLTDESTAWSSGSARNSLDTQRPDMPTSQSDGVFRALSSRFSIASLRQAMPKKAQTQSEAPNPSAATSASLASPLQGRNEATSSASRSSELTEDEQFELAKQQSLEEYARATASPASPRPSFAPDEPFLSPTNSHTSEYTTYPAAHSRPSGAGKKRASFASQDQGHYSVGRSSETAAHSSRSPRTSGVPLRTVATTEDSDGDIQEAIMRSLREVGQPAGPSYAARQARAVTDEEKQSVDAVPELDNFDAQLAAALEESRKDYYGHS